MQQGCGQQWRNEQARMVPGAAQPPCGGAAPELPSGNRVGSNTQM